MGIRRQHSDEFRMHFCTFTCFEWISLFEILNSYDVVYNWFNCLKQQGHDTVAYVIMPNHLHTIHYFPEHGYNLNNIISNGKRFMAYELIKRMEEGKHQRLLDHLVASVSIREKKKGQKHKVFKDTFDAKGLYNERIFQQKFKYIHLNPVRKGWQLVNDYRDYEHSSASFYELGIIKKFKPFDYRLLS